MRQLRCYQAAGMALIFSLGACAVAREPQLYPINDTANQSGVLDAKMLGHGEGHGTLEIVAPDGEKFQGEYSIVFGSSVGFRSILATSSGAAGSATTSGFSTNVAISGSGQGSAVLSGDRGTSIQCEFLNNNLTGHGYGGCQSSKGGLYRMVY
ncbi:MAG: hypothetical protein WAU78_15185 [Roseiarcus sp.]